MVTTGQLDISAAARAYMSLQTPPPDWYGAQPEQDDEGGEPRRPYIERGAAQIRRGQEIRARLLEAARPGMTLREISRAARIGCGAMTSHRARYADFAEEIDRRRAPVSADQLRGGVGGHTALKRRRILDVIQPGMTKAAIAEAAGVTRNVLRHYARRFPEFAEEMAARQEGES